MCSSKKGISAHQLHRMLDVTYKSAWFMAHRIRYAFTRPNVVDKLKGIVEADETYVGGKSKGQGMTGRGSLNKTPVSTLVERGGNVRSKVVDAVTSKNLKGHIRDHVDKTAVILTDAFKSYIGLKKEYKDHHVVNHSKKEYVRGIVHTNTVEGYFSILKRGINGVYQHVSRKHLHRYLCEFDFRYNQRKITDNERTIMALKSIEGKRLHYRD